MVILGRVCYVLLMRVAVSAPIQFGVFVVSRTIFYELRMAAEHISRDARCPQIVSNLILKGINLTLRMSPVVTPVNPPGQ